MAKKGGKTLDLKELNQAISECLSESNSCIDVKFGFLKLGLLCNASASYAFTSANCNIENIKHERKHYFLSFKKLFHLGLELLRDFTNKTRILEEKENEAIEKLTSFFNDKGRYDLCTDKTYTFINKMFYYEMNVNVWNNFVSLNHNFKLSSRLRHN